MRRTGLAVLACLSLIATGACKGDTKRAAPTTTSSSSTTSTSVLPTTTTAPARQFTNAISDDPAAAAADIAAAEYAVLQTASSPNELSNAAVQLQLAYRKIAARDPSVEAAVSAALPDQTTRNALRYNVYAARHLIALTGNSKAKDAPPAAWRIVAPAPAAELEGYYKEASQATGVPWPVLAAVHLVETRMGRIRGESSAGAQGPMQFLPSTWAAYGQGDINSNHDAIMTAARYLKANGAPERLDDAIFRYNHSRHYVEAVKAYAGRIAEDTKSFAGYHEWAVLYRTTSGTLLLPIGWPDIAAVPVIS